MVSTFITPVLTQASQLGVGLFEDTAPIELWPGYSEAEIEILIRAVYRQVLGNAYVMESERLTIPESQLKQGDISVREFVRQVAKSELYRSRFFDNCYRYRAIELNFKHLLGRAPDSYEEMTAHSQILDRGGFEAEIDSYLDSDEYQDAFGENRVPFYRGYKTQTGKSMVGFTHMFQLLRGASSSDKGNIQGNRSRLNRSLITNTPSAVAPASGRWFSREITDVNKLLAEVLKPKPQPSKSPVQAYGESIAQTGTYQALQRQCQEQAQLIETLQQQLADMRPLATIAEAQSSKWQSYSPSVNAGSELTASLQPQSQVRAQIGQSDSYQSLQQRSEEQEQAIASLRQQISQLRALATVGEARLNKWRSRSFSS